MLWSAYCVLCFGVMLCVLCFGVRVMLCRGVTLIRELVSGVMGFHYKVGHGIAMPDTLASCERENKKPRVERG